MKIRSVKVGANNITVEVIKPSANDRPPEIDKLTCPSRPHDQFSQAFVALEPVFCEQFEVAKKWADKLTIKGLSITEREDGELSAIIRASREFGKSGTTITTIKTPAFVYDGERACCSGAHADAIKDAAAAALRYYHGERQTTLLSGKEPTSKETEDPSQGRLPNT